MLPFSMHLAPSGSFARHLACWNTSVQTFRAFCVFAWTTVRFVFLDRLGVSASPRRVYQGLLVALFGSDSQCRRTSFNALFFAINFRPLANELGSLGTHSKANSYAFRLFRVFTHCFQHISLGAQRLRPAHDAERKDIYSKEPAILEGTSTHRPAIHQHIHSPISEFISVHNLVLPIYCISCGTMLAYSILLAFRPTI